MKTKRVRRFCGCFSLFFSSIFARWAAGRSGEEPCEDSESSWTKVAMYEVTAVESVVSGSSVRTPESQLMMEKREPAIFSRMVATSWRTPSIRGFLPSQSSAAMEPVRSMTM